MSNTGRPDTQFEKFLESYFEELCAMSDEDVLDGEDPAAVMIRAEARLSAAKSAAGRSRLAAARAKLDSGMTADISIDDVSVNEARAYIDKVANDPRYTMAARKLGDISDEEIMRLYRQMRMLESENPGTDE